jgi:hypothetical protein
MKPRQTIVRFALTVFVLAPSVAVAASEFGLPQMLASYAHEDAFVGSARVATDGAGVWIAVWHAEGTPFGAAGEQVAVYSRSVDDAATWSAGALLRPEFADATVNPAIATNAGGRWIVAVEHDGLIQITTSNDDGLSWSAPETIYSPATFSSCRPQSIVTDGTGLWIVAWYDSDGIELSRSEDDGLTWSAPQVLSSDVTSSLCGYGALGGPRLRGAGDGTWIAVWQPDYPFWSPAYSRSVDGGMTWGPVEKLSNYPLIGSVAHIDTDGEGTWFVAWSSRHQNDIEQNLRGALSIDNGASFQTSNFPEIANLGNSVHVAALGNDEWQLAWTSTDFLDGSIGNDSDILTMYSRDGGASWSSPSALLTSARADGEKHDSRASLAVVRETGRAGVVSVFSDAGTVGIEFAGASRECPAAPRNDCFTALRERGSNLFLNDSQTTLDRIQWKWRYGAEVTPADFGDPSVSGDYVVCLYERLGANPGLIGEWDIGAASTCSGKPCWRTKATSVLYSDRAQSRGAVRSLKIKAGADERSSLLLRMSGPSLATPKLPLDVSAPVRLQLHSLGTSACWDGTHDQAETNDDKFFSSEAP